TLFQNFTVKRVNGDVELISIIKNDPAMNVAYREMPFVHEDLVLDEEISNFFRTGRIGQVGYISLSSMNNQSETMTRPSTYFDREFDQAVNSVLETDGLIIDLRQNIGGYFNIITDSLSPLIDNRAIARDAFTYLQRKQNGVLGPFKLGHNIPYTPAFINDGQYDKPIIVIVDSLSCSAADIFAYVFSQIPNATIIGQPPCSSFSGYSNPKSMEVRGGNARAILSYPDIFLFSNTTYDLLEGRNYVDIPVDYRYEDILDRRDTFVDRALEIISNNNGLSNS
ncbi:MAG: S41 family peptidase, partial [Spirochaetaceae bacterium]|nr:S41 family peptidase [Spirochaetaceae bacterium]